MRASDSERDGVIKALRGHAAEGRLDLAELEQRVASALRARTREELDGLTADLPRGRPRRRRKPELRPYLAVMVLLLVIWAATGAGYFWPLWPMLGWGVPLLMGRRACSLGSRRHELAHLRSGNA
jgi:hypothetical protein